jgi:glycosyltransferase involved in cell wall biosynthesis/transposase-like protein
MATVGRKNQWAEFRARVALHALQEDRSPEELARRFGVSVEEIAAWRQFLLEHASEAFGLEALRQEAGVSRSRGDREAALEEAVARLDEAFRKSEGEVVRLGAALTEQRALLAARESEIARLSEEIAARDSRIADLRRENVEAQALVGKYLSSLSWRITAPLRTIGGFALAALRFASRPARAPAAVAEPPKEMADPASPAGDSPQPPGSHGPAVPAPPQALEDPFDPDFYLENYPDVRNYLAGPLHHYLTHGKKEGRAGTLPPFEMTGDFAALDPGRDTVLIVSHEASRTGAPILCLDLVRRLKERHNIVVLLLKGGAIADDFRRSADVVVGPLAKVHSEMLVSLNIAQLLSRCPVSFALVNSIVSRLVLPELARHFVPTVTLIHEFASYTRPRDSVADTLFWSADVVFSAEVVRENAIATLSDLAARPGTVLHQGRCAVEAGRLESSVAQAEALRIRESLRPAGWPRNTMVILGVGYVQIRKGVDLFVACAARVLRAMGDRPCRFVWIGDGYDPERDNGYSSYLEDQVARAGLGDRFAFIGETSAIDTAYAEADVLVLSSRLDPLPNVAIDAMEMGRPLVCFDRATGVAEILRENGLADECVAAYLDVEGLATRVLALIESAPLRASLGKRLHEVAARVFDMEAYVEGIEAMARRCIEKVRQEARDCAAIVDSDLVDLEFMAAPGSDRAKRDVAVREFVRAWATGVRLRKPFPGFHPGIYADREGVRGGGPNPFAQYLRAGAPDGPWRFNVIHPSVEGKVPARNPRILLHVHVADPAALAPLMARLDANATQPEIVVSLPPDGATREVAALLESSARRPVRMRVVPGGADGLETFFGALRELDPGAHEIVGHVQAAADVPSQAFLLENLLGGRFAMIDAIAAAFVDHETLGLAYPDDPNVFGWSGSREHAARIGSGLELGPLPERHLNFPSEGVFWARSAALHAFVASPFIADRVRQSGPDQKTLYWQAVRRLLPIIVARSGFGTAVTHVPGVSRADKPL